MKILFLGGAYSQLPAILYAKSIGLEVITVDYLPSNPGHKISDEYYNISTVDMDSILELCKKLKIDAISAYASDPAAPTAAYVSENLGLVGSSYKSVMTLSDKILFRAFLQENGFKTPWYLGADSLDILINRYPGGKAVLKPVDSSGSKGVSLVNCVDDIIKHFPMAMEYSRQRQVIVEEFIERKGPQIHGEGFAINGEVVFLLLGDQVFSPVNCLIPYSTIVPSIFHRDIMDEAHNLVKAAIRKVGFDTGGLNIEIIRDKHDGLYILEIGARNGGNYMPQLMMHATGFNLAKANVDSLLKQSKFDQQAICIYGNYLQIILHSETDGIFHDLVLPDHNDICILEKNIFYEFGDSIRKYNSSADVVGVIISRIMNDIDMIRFKEIINQFKICTKK